MRFRVLGPLEAQCEGRWKRVGTDKVRSLFACLLINAGQLVSSDSLIFELWGDRPPPTAGNLISVYVHHLRRGIGDAEGLVLQHRRPGYQVAVGPDETDLQQFESLVARGRDELASGRAKIASDLLGEAEGLWRGRFLADVVPSLLVSTEADRTAEIRVSAAELRVTADLECGRHVDVIPELQHLVAVHPLRERLWLLLMQALSGAGRYAESVGAYAQAKAVLAEQLGVDPGPELRQLHAELLAGAVPKPRPASSAGDAETEPRRPRSGRSPAAVPAGGPDPLAPTGVVETVTACPAQLPADIADFTGRGPETDRLCAMLTGQDPAQGAGSVQVALVAGTAGLGKTVLAVHAAHRVRELFPDGQLYADLSGASAAPAEPGEVLARLLRDLGVDGGKVPGGVEERAALYRTRLSGRRVLILLDDAKDAAQVRPLLPGSPSCAVLVTSRDRTSHLVCSGFIDLAVMPASEALALLSRIVGDGRASAESAAAEEVVAACGGMPLAVRICAARLATRSRWPVATLAARLRDERRRLDELRVGDLEVRATFKMSYDALGTVGGRAASGRVLRLLGIWQGQQISLAAAAALLGEREADVAEALEALVDANLLESPEPDRYQFHDLLRLFAGELAQSEETAEERQAAEQRLLHWYLRTAEATADAVAPRRYRAPGTRQQECGPLPPAGEPLAWYDREQGNVIAAIRQAAEAGAHDTAWRLATALAPLFYRLANWADCITVHRIAVESARAAESRPGQAWALQNLGQGLLELGEAESFACLREALAIREETSDLAGQAQTLLSLGLAHHKVNGPQAAYDHSLRHWETLLQTGNAAYIGVGLINHSEFCLELGRLDEAFRCLQRALAIFTVIEGYELGHVLKNLGRIHLASGRLDEAIAHLTDAHRHYQATGQIKWQAEALKHLSEAQHLAGHQDQARTSLSAALALFSRLQGKQEVPVRSPPAPVMPRRPTMSRHGIGELVLCGRVWRRVHECLI
jgi:DNA-binding SARP family transcriptional activator/tetratricopeptide (TPR) repeat protein